MDGIFDGGGTQGSAKLAFTVAKGNVLADVWISFVVGRTTLHVPFEGEYQCTGNECTLKATSTEAVPPLSPTPYFRSGDRLSLHGKPGAGLEGTLQAEGREVFKDQSQEVKYNLKFSKP